MKKQTFWASVVIEKERRDNFKKRYGACFSHFVRNAVNMALRDVDFFIEVMKGGENAEKE